MEITRSEEELRLTSTWRPVERLRLRKRVVTEQRVVTIELRREELVVERERIVDAPATDPEPGPREPLVITLSEERAVITTVVVPVERVRVTVDRVTEEHELVTSLRAEQVDVVEQPLPPAT